MARMALVKADILFFCALHFIVYCSTGGKFEMTLHNKSQTGAVALNMCSPKGQLPLPMSKKEHEMVTKVMQSKGVISIWLGAKRKRLDTWTWINGTKLGSAYAGTPISATDKQHCSLYDQTTADIQAADCSKHRIGHICEVQDCRSCSRFHWKSQICREKQNSCYLFYCDDLGWYNARAGCVAQTLDLATIPNNAVLVWLKNQDFTCHRFWIGLRREEWVDTENRQVVTGAWRKHEPSLGDCASLEKSSGRPEWVSRPCHEKLATICLTNKEMDEDREPLNNSEKWATTHMYKTTSGTDFQLLLKVGIPVSLLLTIIIITTLCVLIQLKKRNRRHRHPREDPDNNHENITLLGNQKKRIIKTVKKYTLSKYNVVPLYRDQSGCFKNVEHIYTDMIWTYEPSQDMIPVDYKDMFTQADHDSTPKRILITAGSGMGKTTLIKRILVDWAKKRRTNDVDRKQHEAIKHFQFVIPVFLEEIKERCTLSQLLKGQFRECAEDYLKLLEHKQDKSLIILDGYDRFEPDHCQDIVEIITEKYLPDATKLITCRTPGSYYMGNLDTEYKPDRTFTLRGFSKCGVEQYIDKCPLTDDAFKGKLKDKIKTTAELTIISRFPVLLRLLCGKCQQIFSDDINLYEEIVKYAILRYENIFEDRRHDSHEYLKSYRGELLEIGKLVLDNVPKIQNMDLVLKENVPFIPFLQATGKISEKALKLGLLNYEIGDKVSFPHSHLNLFFLAFVLCYSEEIDLSSVVNRIRPLLVEKENCEIFLKFIMKFKPCINDKVKATLNN